MSVLECLLSMKKYNVCSPEEAVFPNRDDMSLQMFMESCKFCMFLSYSGKLIGATLTNKFSAKMLDSSLKIIKGVSSLMVLSQLRPNVDDSSCFVHTKEIYFFNPYVDGFVG